MEQQRSKGERNPEWGGWVSGPLKKEEHAYQMCHPRMCWRLFKKDNYENLMKLMTFTLEAGVMVPNHDGLKECGSVANALRSSQQILKNYGRTLQIQKLLYNPQEDKNLDPRLVCREYLELHEATRVALKSYQTTSKGDYQQPDGMELGLQKMDEQANDNIDGYKRARSNAMEGSDFAKNNKWAPRFERTGLAKRRKMQRLHEWTYKWM